MHMVPIDRNTFYIYQTPARSATERKISARKLLKDHVVKLLFQNAPVMVPTFCSPVHHSNPGIGGRVLGVFRVGGTLWVQPVNLIEYPVELMPVIMRLAAPAPHYSRWNIRRNEAPFIRLLLLSPRDSALRSLRVPVIRRLPISCMHTFRRTHAK